MFLRENTRGDIKDGHHHAAGDIHADAIGDDRILGGKHAADREAVSSMRVRHQRSCHRHRQMDRRIRLRGGCRVNIRSPHGVRVVFILHS